MFAGFRSGYWQLFLGYLVPALAYLACLLPFLIIYFIKVMPILSQLQHTNPNDMQNALPQIMPALKSVFLTSLPILFVCMIPVIYLTVNWQFTLPLIIDKKMSFWPAMKASWKMTHKHWWHLFGLVVVIGLLNIAGMVPCCIGLLFTIPLGFAALMCAYETIFSAEKK
jgi:membrane-anchored glycerophosphoryl diester phosphodiesterase (GDPDase)